MPQLSCYLVHYQAPAWCCSAVQSILGSQGLQVSVTIVDNGGWAESGLRVPAHVRVLDMGANLGFAGGANAAIRDWWERRPDEELLLIGAHDLHVEPHALAVAVAAAARSPEYGILGVDEVDEPPLTIEPDRGEGWAIEDRQWVPGLGMLLRRACLAEIGGFDQIYGSYTEDRDLCLRARDHGWKVGIVRNSTGWGLGRSSPKASELHFANRVLLNVRRGQPWIAMKKSAWLVGALGADLVRGFDPRVDPASRRQLRLRALARFRGLIRAARMIPQALRLRDRSIARFPAQKPPTS